MSASSANNQFIDIFRTLPPEVQTRVLENQLCALLDPVLIPETKIEEILKAAQDAKRAYTSVPSLDLKGKKREINALIDLLRRDSKCAFSKERSNRDEILLEIIDSLVYWLNDIWSVTYEYSCHFSEAHSSLLYVAEVLNKVSETSGHSGCTCFNLNQPVPIAIKRHTGKVVKNFSLVGARNVQQALLWIWRDLFLAMSASGGAQARQCIPEMLEDIEDLLGWNCLERLLYGGKASIIESLLALDDGDDAWEDEDDVGDDYKEDGNEEDDTDEDEVVDPSCEEKDGHCHCHYARHWTSDISSQHIFLRDHVEKRLKALFSITPSLALYSCIISLSNDSSMTRKELLSILTTLSGSSSDTLAATLDICSHENDAKLLSELLTKHSHLLRPRDARSLQAAVLTLSDTTGYLSRATHILEKELTEVIQAVRASVLSNFCKITDPAHHASLLQILKLPTGSSQRADRVESWVEAVATPSTAPLNPGAFVALLMGLPAPGLMEEADDSDLVGYLDIDKTDDPDLDDLRDEFRPKLKERFNGWCDVAVTIKGGTAIMLRVYAKTIDSMAFLRGPDIVEEMISRINDRPSRRHIVDALESLVIWAKHQRKKINARVEKKRKATASSKPPPQPAASTFSAPLYPTFGGLDDVD